MNPKRICIIVRKSLRRHGTKVTEAARMGIGLTLREQEVYLIFLEDGLDALEDGSEGKAGGEEFQKHLRTFIELGQTLVVEEESLGRRRRSCRSWEPEIWPRQAIIQFTSRCDGIIII